MRRKPTRQLETSGQKDGGDVPLEMVPHCPGVPVVLLLQHSEVVLVIICGLGLLTFPCRPAELEEACPGHDPEKRSLVLPNLTLAQSPVGQGGHSPDLLVVYHVQQAALVAMVGEVVGLLTLLTAVDHLDRSRVTPA